jgi:hypothetical protein
MSGSDSLKETEEILERIGPYLSDLQNARMLIEVSLKEEDPVRFLEERLRSTEEGPLKGDIRIIINELDR